MGRNRSNLLTEAEWKVMRIVWERKSCAARDVYLAAGEAHGWAPGTVKTILRRLVEKGYLRTTRVGNSFLYRPTRPALKSLCAAADSLLNHALEGTVGPLLAYMVKKGNLSAAEIAELRRVFDESSSSKED